MHLERELLDLLVHPRGILDVHKVGKYVLKNEKREQLYLLKDLRLLLLYSSFNLSLYFKGTVRPKAVICSLASQKM